MKKEKEEPLPLVPSNERYVSASYITQGQHSCVDCPFKGIPALNMS